jgi:two-component system LytT family response regulator
MKSMLSVLILDDEPKAIESLEWELSTFCPNVEVTATFTNPVEAQLFLKKNTVDCIFLDIEMPQMDGFQFLDELPNREFAVIITTAYDQYALHAIKERALDYLLKPIDSDDLAEAVKRVDKYKQSSQINDRLEEVLLNLSSQANNKGGSRIGFSFDGKILFLTSDEIIYCEGDGNYTNVVLEKGKKLLISQTLKKVEEKLPADEFFRVHNSYIINLSQVREYLKTDGYVVLMNEKKIPVSRNRKVFFLDEI